MKTSVEQTPQSGNFEKLIEVRPLNEFYAEAQRKLPPIAQVSKEEIPEPYKSLLVHNNDMTSTLEKFHGDKVRLKLLSRRRAGDLYFREVVLVLDKTEKPVEFGAIKINLALFDSEPRKLILAERFPLGQILSDQSIAYDSCPTAFLKVQSDDFINHELKLPESRGLYGRRNVLTNLMQDALAEIVEILPP